MFYKHHSSLLLNICKAFIYKFAMFYCIPLDLELLVAQTSYSVECQIANYYQTYLH